MRNGGIQLRISDLLFAVQKRWKTIVALAIIGAVLGLLLSGMSYVQSSLASYSVSGSLAINTRRDNGTYLYGDEAPSQNDYHLAEDMVDAVIYIMRSERVLSEVINRLELLGISWQDLRSSLSISSYNATQILEMSITWTSGEEGESIWHAIVDCANAVFPDTLLVGHLAIINDCTSTLMGMGGSIRTVPVLLSLLGLAAGIGLAIMEVLMHPTLTNVRDVEDVLGLETIGLIPRDADFFRKKGSLLVRDESGQSPISQNYSSAAYILRNRLGTSSSHHCFYVTSTSAREGRSTVAANLAIQLSDMNHRTLLVDLDTRNPGLGALFMESVDYHHSLNALYRGEINEDEAITPLTGYLDILPTTLEHDPIPMDAMVIDLIERLSQKYEYVILDAPPVGREAETLSLNQIATTVLFVVGYDSVSIPEIQTSLEKLDKSGIRVLGCVVNNVQGTRYRSIGEREEVRKKLRTARKKKNAADEPFVSPASRSVSEAEQIVNARKTHSEEKDASVDTASDAPANGPENNTVSTPAGTRPKRNVMEELANEAKTASSMTDQDALAELYKLGLESPETSAAPEDENA